MGPQDLEQGLPGLPGWPRDREPSATSNAAGLEVTHVTTSPWADLPPAVLAPNRSLAPAPGRTPPVVESEVMPAARGNPTLTQQMRNIQPPDVARQAVSELGVLARELDALPDMLVDAGLARSHVRAYLETVQDYLDLCRYAWEAVAEEQLEQAGAEPEYRQCAVGVARRITHLKQDCDQATAGGKVQPPRRLPLMWRRRVRLIRSGLIAWQAQLAPVPNPLLMGRGLFTLQGYVGLASAGGLELALLDILVSTTVAMLGLVTVGATLALGSAALAGRANVVPTDAVIAATCAVGWIAAILVSASGPMPLGLMLGASVFVPSRAACLGWQGSQAAAGLLRLWWLVIGGVALVLVPAAVIIGGVALTQNEPLPFPSTAAQAMGVFGSTLYRALVQAAVVSAAGLLLLAFPFALTSQVRFAREIANNVRWVPAARRYALRPALALLIFITALVLAVDWYVATSLGWQHVGLLRVSVAFVHGTLTLRSLTFMLVLALPYLLLLDLPFRIGMGRWRVQRLTDLEARRADLESQVRRLATQPATDDLLRAMQYDLVLLQFYRGQIDEARSASNGPFRIEGRVVAVVASVASALLLDSAGGVVFGLLTGQH
jgi:hypothetical protein